MFLEEETSSIQKSLSSLYTCVHTNLLEEMSYSSLPIKKALAIYNNQHMYKCTGLTAHEHRN